MTVADWLKELPDDPVYLHTPAGPIRVMGVVSKGDRLPFLICLAPSGQVIEWAVLYSTELVTGCPDCQGAGEIPSSDMPGMMCTCPCRCDVAGAHVQQYP